MLRTSRTLGFTLIEMLLVISIMGLMASVVFVQLNSARARERDTHRERDIKTIQNALALYVVNNRYYPVYSGALTGSDIASQALINGEAIPQMPHDPVNTDNYRYTYDSTDGSTYTLTYYLETDTIFGKSAGQQTVAP